MTKTNPWKPKKVCVKCGQKYVFAGLPNCPDCGGEIVDLDFYERLRKIFKEKRDILEALG